MSKMSMRNVRNAVKQDFSLIERIWADYGVVKVQDKKGEIYSMTVREAAMRASKLNEGLPEEKSAREVVYKLIARITEVCREALRQRESPKDQENASVTKAIDMFELGAIIQDSPEMRQRISLGLFKYPSLDADELRAIYRKESLSREFQEEIAKAAHDERIEVWNKQHVLTPPLA